MDGRYTRIKIFLSDPDGEARSEGSDLKCCGTDKYHKRIWLVAKGFNPECICSWECRTNHSRLPLTLMFKKETPVIKQADIPCLVCHHVLVMWVVLASCCWFGFRFQEWHSTFHTNNFADYQCSCLWSRWDPPSKVFALPAMDIRAALCVRGLDDQLGTRSNYLKKESGFSRV